MTVCRECENKKPIIVQYPTLVRKNPGIAGLLSYLVLGLGQIYVGKLSRGLAFVLVGIVLWSIHVTFTIPYISDFGMGPSS